MNTDPTPTTPTPPPLLTCPFCGLTDRDAAAGMGETPAVASHSYPGGYRVECEGCGCKGPFAPEHAPALAAWNNATTAPLRARVAELEARVARLRAALETCDFVPCTRYDRNGYGYDSWECVYDKAKVAAALTNPASHEPTN